MRRYRRRVLGAAFVAAMSLALVAPTAPAANIPHGRESTPGAPGIGDRYFPRYGNGGYRVSHYDIDVAYKPGSGRLTGTTTIDARARKDLSRFNLDFLLRVTSVRIDGQPATWSRDGRLELVVTPTAALMAGQRFEVEVAYTGVPEDVRFHGIGGWMSEGRAALALGEPEVAAWWFPSNDHPADKARFDITARVPAGVEAISNGRLVSSVTAGRRSVWHWRLGSPAATYLAFIAIGQYDIESGTTPSGRKYLNAYAKGLPDDYAEAARRSVRKTPEVTDFLERRFGPYPFRWIGGVVPPHEVGFALENQTRPVYSKWFFFGANTWIIAHEIAHQWYGDSVAVRRWRHIWLNEGFATYATWLWDAHIGGWSPERTFEAYYRWNGPNQPFWKVPIGNPGPKRLFHGAVYDRGAMTLQALRNKIGREDLFRLLQRWAAQNRGGNATTRDFITMAERVSGKRSLDRFFDVWLFRPKRPAATVANGFPPDFPRFAAPGEEELSERYQPDLRRLRAG